MSVLVMIAVVAFSFAIGYACAGRSTAERRTQLPPATARQIKRAQRASRAHLELALDSKFISPANADFSEGETR